jgi:hypothetical protein
MPASNFQPQGSVAPGGRGRCRYRFTGPDEDPLVGRIECHEVDLFHFVYAPLPCLAELKK